MSLKAVSFFNILEFMQTFLNHLLIIKSVSNAWIFNDGSIIMILKTLTAWKVSKYGVFSSPYFPEFGLNTERHGVSLRIQSECGKIRTRKNSVFEQFMHQFNFTPNSTQSKNNWNEITGGAEKQFANASPYSYLS